MDHHDLIYTELWVALSTLWPKDYICNIDLGQQLAQEMACCLTPPNHCPNQCWLIIKSALWHSPENNFTRIDHELICNRCLEITLLKSLSHLPGANELMRGLWHHSGMWDQQCDIIRWWWVTVFKMLLTILCYIVKLIFDSEDEAWITTLHHPVTTAVCEIMGINIYFNTSL